MQKVQNWNQIQCSCSDADYAKNAMLRGSEEKLLFGTKDPILLYSKEYGWYVPNRIYVSHKIFGVTPRTPYVMLTVTSYVTRIANFYIRPRWQPLDLIVIRLTLGPVCSDKPL